MLLLTKPATQDRLNAAVVEVLGLNVMGPIGIQGASWDIHNTVRYIEARLKQPLTVVLDSESQFHFFHANKKRVCFTSSGVLIFPI